MLCMLDHNVSFVNTSVGTNVLAFVLPGAHRVKELPEVLYRCPDDPCVITYHGVSWACGTSREAGSTGNRSARGVSCRVAPAGRQVNKNMPCILLHVIW